MFHFQQLYCLYLVRKHQRKTVQVPLQEPKYSKIPRFRESEILRSEDSVIPRFQDSKDPKIPRSQDSKIPRSQDSKIPRFQDPHLPFVSGNRQNFIDQLSFLIQRFILVFIHDLVQEIFLDVFYLIIQQCLRSCCCCCCCCWCWCCLDLLTTSFIVNIIGMFVYDADLGILNNICCEIGYIKLTAYLFEAQLFL